MKEMTEKELRIKELERLINEIKEGKLKICKTEKLIKNKIIIVNENENEIDNHSEGLCIFLSKLLSLNKHEETLFDVNKSLVRNGISLEISVQSCPKQFEKDFIGFTAIETSMNSIRDVVISLPTNTGVINIFYFKENK